MKEKVIYLRCERCGVLNKVDTTVPAQGCIKCGKKIVVPQSERKIIVNN